MIVFVGDKPSKKNVDPNIPFVGTQSYKRLLEWIWKMDLDINKIKLINKDKIKSTDNLIGSSNFRWVALGDNAEKYLKKNFKCIEEEFEHFKLPHPSGKNRKLNDKKYVDQQLKLCKEWLEDK